MNREQTSRAEHFHRLHAGAKPLVLPNAWDVASARIIEEAGADAIVTTSAGMAWAQGYPDGEQMPVHELLAVCQRICSAVSVPVSVDIERGYGKDAEDTGGLVGALIQMGVVGINMEDGVASGTNTLTPSSVLSERIACARAVAQHHNVPLFINARIDTYFVEGMEPAARFEETRRRALAYVAAGADGIFVPGLTDLDAIAQLARMLPVPLNIYAGYSGAPGVKELQQAGVRRVSLGCGPMQAAMAHLAIIAKEALIEGRYDTMAAHMLTVSQANALFRPNLMRHEKPTRRAPDTGMGDGPVALLFARPRADSRRDGVFKDKVQLTTRNGTHLFAADGATDNIGWQDYWHGSLSRLMAAFHRARPGETKEGSR